MANQSRPSSNVSFMAGNRTQVSAGKAFVIGVLVAAAIYFLAWLFKGPDSRHPALVYEYLWDRGYVQYFSTLAFGWAIGFFWLKIDLIRSQKRAFSVVHKNVFASVAQESKITTGVAENIRRDLQKLPADARGSMLVNRLENACRRLINIRSAAEVDNIFQMLSEQDAALIESSYTVVKFLFALIPLLGFIGNVLGVGNGIGAFAGALGGSTQTFQELKPVLQFASLKLASAFDTTFLALAYSGIILAINAVMQQSEENLLAAVDEYCLDRFVSRIEVQSSDISDLKAHLTNLASDVNVAIDSGCNGIVQRIGDLAQKELAVASSKQLEALNKLESAVGRLGGGGTALDGIKESVAGIYQVLEDRTGTLVSKLDALGKIAGLGAIAEKLDGILQKLQSVVDGQKGSGDLAAIAGSLQKLSEKLGTLESAAAAFSGMEGMLTDLRGALDALKPAIDSMSAEMAKEVNQVLEMLLRVMVVANRMHHWAPEERKVLIEPNLLERTFGKQVDGHY